MAALLIPVAFLLLILVWLFLMMVNQGYRYTFGTLLGWLSDNLRKISVGVLLFGFQPFHSLADVIDDASNYILRMMGAGIEAIEDGIVRFWGGIVSAISGIGETVEQLTDSTGSALHTLRRSTIGKIVVGTLGLLPSLVWTHRTQIAALHKTIARLPLLSVKEVRHLIARSEALTLPRIGRIERNVEAQTDRLSRLEKGAIIGTAVGVVGYALSKLGLSHLFKSQCKTNTKQLCAANPSWLENILLGALTVFGGMSLIRLADYLRPLVTDAAAVVSHFWKADVAGASVNPDFGSGGLAAVRNPSFGEA